MSAAWTMPPALRELFPTGQTLSAKLSMIAQGMRAEVMLAERGLHGDRLVLLPAFAAAHPERDTSDGDRIALIQWSTGPVLLGFSELESTWRISDSVLATATGRATIVLEEMDLGGLRFAEGTRVRTRRVHGAGGVRRELEAVRNEGRAASIELLRALTNFTRRAVERAGVRVYREITGTTSSEQSVIDQIEEETIVDVLLYGDSSDDASTLLRLIRRSAASDVLATKSAAAYISAAVWSGAETEVRRKIGDPHAGRVIRRIARQIASRDAGEVLKAYRIARPGQSIGLSRIEAALSAGSSATAHQHYLDEIEGDS